MVDVSFVPHRCGEVAGGDEEDVDMVHFQNFVQIFVGDDVFEEDDEKGVFVRNVHEVGNAETLSTGVAAALADGWELATVDDVLSLCGVVDVGHDDALGTAVQSSIDQALVVVIDPANGCEPPEVAGAGEVSEFGCVNPSVLTFQPDAVEAMIDGDGAERVDVVGMRHSTDDGCDLACS